MSSPGSSFLSNAGFPGLIFTSEESLCTGRKALTSTQAIPIPGRGRYDESDGRSVTPVSNDSETASTSSSSFNAEYLHPDPERVIIPRKRTHSWTTGHTLTYLENLTEEQVNENYVSELHHQGLRLTSITGDIDAVKRKVKAFKALYLPKTGRNNLPGNDIHKHLEGVPTAYILKEVAVGSKLFYDKIKQEFRRKQYSTKRDIEQKNPRIPAQEVSFDIFQKACIAQTEGAKAFHDTFALRGSILDRCDTKEYGALAVQILHVLKTAKREETQYQEVMYGIYDVPVPEKFLEYIEPLKSNMTKENIEACVIWLKSSFIGNVYTSLELEKLQRKIFNRFFRHINLDEPHLKKLKIVQKKDPEGKPLLDSENKPIFFLSHDSEDQIILSYEEEKAFSFYIDFLKLNYIEAQNKYIRLALEECEADIKKALANVNKAVDDPYGLEPNDNIYSVHSKRTVKFIFEVMRHKNLGLFFAWILSSCMRIQEDIEDINKTVKTEVGITIDGPQTELNAISDFNAQILIELFMHDLYPDVPISQHCSEYEEEFSHENPEEIKKVLPIVIPMPGKIAGRLGHASHVVYDKELFVKAVQKHNLTIEFIPSTAIATTNTILADLPMQEYFELGLLTALGTDDPGIIKGTTRIGELINIIIQYNFSYQDVKNIIRTGLVGSFLQGESIYDIHRIDESIIVKADNGRTVEKEMTKVKFVLKEQYKDIFSSQCDPLILEELFAKSEKAKKQWDLEKGFREYERDMYQNAEEIYKLNIFQRPKQHMRSFNPLQQSQSLPLI